MEGRAGKQTYLTQKRKGKCFRQLIRLSNGVMVIDTPGMCEIGMWDVSTGLGEAFTDVESYFSKCRFSDCRHQGEPDCAIKAAIYSF